ncbi:hypothetical protein TVAG_109630 [Trichomonas vaginalis G3]|uniref:Uncharacterized protein n=1 Tax=Trichomonas vaginalis (strain ATCC PRA-98 / G3) TaxID=412133 RepID=A2EAF2_TRIV3|nr:hypothetical protein TVAGG3_0924090 [Trichomonas vaginalis G3]EAY10379.1 hypothetical protein TVAG_109630 [Trichomonas vaginalis G3]KAI5485331.1 hypothetical protein TVAGG3_0924090 [Trichomonas vaginalis G3]|eukprot:XP_001322602.1 hypothetical protein [Trichomonas vaginalis G3]
MSDLSDQAMYQIQESSSTDDEPVKEPSYHEPPKTLKPFAMPTTSYDQVPDPLDVEPDIIFQHFKFYE